MGISLHKYYFILSLALSLIVFKTQTQLVKKGPDFFYTTFCTIGTKTNTTSGNFTCVSTRPLTNVIKTSMSLVQLTRLLGQVANFQAIMQSPNTGSITTFNFGVDITIPSSLKLSWYLIAICNQGTKKWIDLIQAILLPDATNTIKTSTVGLRTLTLNLDYSLNTIFTSGTPIDAKALIGSFYATVTNSGTYPLTFNLKCNVPNATHLSIIYQVASFVALRNLRGFILIYDPASISTQNGSLQDGQYALISSSIVTFHTSHPNWGPAFLNKCLLGTSKMSDMLTQGVRIQLVFNAQGNFYAVTQNSPTSSFHSSMFLFFCLGDGRQQCGQNFNFYDSGTNACYVGNSCPITTIDPGNPMISRNCRACYDYDCINCTGNTSYCLTCDSLLHSTAITGDCICDTGYIRIIPSQPCQFDCSIPLIGCEPANCTSTDYCTVCAAGYYINPIDATHQTCIFCNSTTSNCDQCTGVDHCTKCFIGYFIDITSYWNGTATIFTQKCLPCNIPRPHCQQCSTSTSCDVCESGYSNSAGFCACDTAFIPQCTSCTIAFKCDACVGGYFADPTTKQCVLCTTLSHCSSCLDFDTCDACVDLYAPSYSSTSNATTCQSCSLVIPHCTNCTDNSTCIDCDPTYGVSMNSSCQLCSTLKPHCLYCDIYTACIQCQNDNISYLSLGNCLYCPDTISNCNSGFYNTTSATWTCLGCQTGFFLNTSTNLCLKCSDYIYDCDDCTLNFFTNLLQCTLCSNLFLVDSDFTCQLCKVNQYVTRTCTNVTGCASSQMISGKLICLSCDSIKYFQYDPKTKSCECQVGFSLNKVTKLCQSKCGDGIQVIGEICQDGNILSGDGCSDICQVQVGFDCSNIVNGITKCILLADITITFDYISRNLEKNEASLYFTVTPKSTFLSKVDWSKTVTFDFSAITSSSFKYEDGVLVITMEYSSDIQDKILDIKINFDPSMVLSSSQTLSLKLSALNGPLVYDSDSGSSYTTVKISGIVLGVLCLGIFLLSSYYHKMIGLQAIQFIQLLYYARVMSQSVSYSSFHAFNSLKYSNGYNIIQDSSQEAVIKTYKVLPPELVKLRMNLTFLQDCNLMLIPVLLSGAAFFFYTIQKSNYRSKFLDTKTKQFKDKYTITMRTVNWIYDNCIFSFVLGLLYVSVFCFIARTTSNLASQAAESNLLVDVSQGSQLLILFLVFSIFSFQMLSGIQKFIDLQDQSPKLRSNQSDLQHQANTSDNAYHPLYVSFYLLFQFMLILVIILVFSEGEYTLQIITTLSFGYFAILVAWRPYLMKVHNVGVILNQFTIVLFFMVMICLKYGIINKSVFISFCYLILVMISISIFIQYVRIYIHRKYEITTRKAKNLLKNGKDQDGQQNVPKYNPKSFIEPLSLQVHKFSPSKSIYDGQGHKKKLVNKKDNLLTKNQITVNKKSTTPIQQKGQIQKLDEQVDEQKQYKNDRQKELRQLKNKMKNYLLQNFQ